MATKTCTSVTLRQRPYKSGRISLYLDYYPPIRNPETMKMSRREYLGLYLIAKPRNAAEREYNADILQKGEAIRNLRFNSIFNDQFGFVDHIKEQADFIAWFKKIADKKKDKWTSAFKHFSNFVGGKCTFGDLTVDLCARFSEYLLEEAMEMRHGKEKLSRNSAAAFYCTFRAALKIAYKTKMLNENINDYLDSIKTEDVVKEFLTLDEVKSLVATPVAEKYEDMKKAALFSCLTGLRISDIENLTWDNIVPASEGGFCMRIRTQKTKTAAVLPISEEALELCGERPVDEEGNPIQGCKVFQRLKRTMICHPFKNWLKAAGITKPCTFHTARHYDLPLCLDMNSLQNFVSWQVTI